MPPPEPRSSTGLAAFAEFGDRGRVAASEGGERRGFGELATLVRVVEHLAEVRGLDVVIATA